MLKCGYKIEEVKELTWKEISVLVTEYHRQMDEDLRLTGVGTMQAIRVGSLGKKIDVEKYLNSMLNPTSGEKKESTIQSEFKGW